MTDTPLSKAWRRTVAQCVCQTRDCPGWPNHQHTEPPHGGPVIVDRVYLVPFGRAWDQWAGDIDKLDRNLFDALGCTREDDAQLIADDSLIVGGSHLKVPCPQGADPGLAFEVRRCVSVTLTVLERSALRFVESMRSGVPGR
jgi:hypothetical protein